MINFDNPFFVSIRLKPKKEINAKNFVDGKMVEVLEKLQEENLDYLLVAGNIVKIVPIWKIGSIINLTKEYSSKVKEESEKLNLENKTLNFLKDKDISLVVSFKEENEIENDLKDYMNGQYSKEYIKVSTKDIKDLEAMIKLYKEVFDVESVELLKLD